MLLFLLLFGCNSNNESSNHCSCPISENVDVKTEKEKQNSENGGGFGAKTDIEAVIKKAVDAKISVSGSYSNSESKIEEVYREIKGANPQITQNANFYRSIACAYYNIACQDKSLNEREKRDRLNEVVAGYEQNINKIINEEKAKKTEIRPAPNQKPTTQSKPIENNPSAGRTENVATSTPQPVQPRKEEPKVEEPIIESESVQEFEKGNWLVNLHGCRQSGNNIICNFTVLNNSVDSKFEVYARHNSRIFASNGNEYGLWDVTMADKSGSNKWTGKDIVRGVPVKMKLSFINVYDKVSTISKMEILARDKKDYFSVIFNNVSVK